MDFEVNYQQWVVTTWVDCERAAKLRIVAP